MEENESDLPEGYRLMSSMTPAERASIDQSAEAARDIVRDIATLQLRHRLDPHPGGPCSIPCSSVEVYEAIEMLSENTLRKVLFAVTHDAAALQAGQTPWMNPALGGNEGV